MALFHPFHQGRDSQIDMEQNVWEQISHLLILVPLNSLKKKPLKIRFCFIKLQSVSVSLSITVSGHLLKPGCTVPVPDAVETSVLVFSCHCFWELVMLEGHWSKDLSECSLQKL